MGSAALLWRRRAAVQASSWALFPGHLELAARRPSPARPGPSQGLLSVSEPCSTPGPSSSRRPLGVLWWAVCFTHNIYKCIHTQAREYTNHMHACTQHSHAHAKHTHARAHSTHMRAHMEHKHTRADTALTCVHTAHVRSTQSTHVHTQHICMNTQHRTPVYPLTARVQPHEAVRLTQQE